MRSDHACASARSASRAAFCAASLALLARISAPMIWPPQITSRDFVLMTGHYSAAASDSQSTRASEVIAPQRFCLVKPANNTGGNMLQLLELKRPRDVEYLLPAEPPPKPGRKQPASRLAAPATLPWGRFCGSDSIDASLNRLRCVELVSGVSTGKAGKNRREGAISRIRRPRIGDRRRHRPEGHALDPRDQVRWISRPGASAGCHRESVHPARQ